MGRPHNRPTNPWWTKECSDALQHRQICSRKWRKSAHSRKHHKQTRNYESKELKTKAKQAKANYVEAKQIAQNIIKQARETGWRTFISEITSDKSSKEIWTKFNRLRGKTYEPIKPLKLNDRFITDNNEKAQVLTNHYKTVASDQNLHPSFLNVKSQQNPIIEQELQANSSLDPEVNEVSLLNRKFVMSELKNALNKKKSTAPGADQIHYNILKQLPNESMEILLSLINSSWEQGTLPDSWKEATIIPIIKPKR